MAAGETLREQGVRAVTAPSVLHLAVETGGVTQHRRESFFRKLLGLIEGRLDEQNRRRILVDVVPDQVLNNARLAYLRRGHHHDLLDERVGARIKDLAEVFDSTRLPSSGPG